MPRYECPQCCADCDTLFEGVCKACCEENQQALDEHNAQVERWAKLTTAQREKEIRQAAGL